MEVTSHTCFVRESFDSLIVPQVRIHCRDHVKRISVYKDKVAVQLPERVIIYELQNKDDPYDMQYRVTAKIHKKLDCNLLVLTSQHLILCLERKFQVHIEHSMSLAGPLHSSSLSYACSLLPAPHGDSMQSIGLHPNALA